MEFINLRRRVAALEAAMGIASAPVVVVDVVPAPAAEEAPKEEAPKEEAPKEEAPKE